MKAIPASARARSEGPCEPSAAAPSLSASSDASLETGAVYRAHVHEVARWVSRLGGPGIDVEELVQEVFLRVHRLLPRFRGEARMTTWLYSITQNVVWSRRRRERFRRLFAFSGDFDTLTLTLASTQPTPVEVLEQRQSLELIYAALEGLREMYRTVFIMFEIDERSGEEIAELTGTRVATVWVRLNRARNQLAARLEKLERKVQR
jgi:RNA polymerase sigma-70 factor (ECF subfamily)